MELGNCLERALKLVRGDRGRDYGRPRDDYGRTAKLWSAYLGVPVTAEQAAVCMILVKVSRLAHSPGHADSIVDIAGYAAVVEDCADAAKWDAPPQAGKVATPLAGIVPIADVVPNEGMCGLICREDGNFLTVEYRDGAWRTRNGFHCVTAPGDRFCYYPWRAIFGEAVPPRELPYPEGVRVIGIMEARTAVRAALDRAHSLGLWKDEARLRRALDALNVPAEDVEPSTPPPRAGAVKDAELDLGDGKKIFHYSTRPDAVPRAEAMDFEEYRALDRALKSQAARADAVVRQGLEMARATISRFRLRQGEFTGLRPRCALEKAVPLADVVPHEGSLGLLSTAAGSFTRIEYKDGAWRLFGGAVYPVGHGDFYYPFNWRSIFGDGVR